MDSEQKQQLTEVITQRMSELEELLHSEVASTEADDIDSQLHKVERRELARLKENLEWLESEDGGCCDHCGCEIPFPRLEAVPTTRLCVNCAEQMEAS